MLLQVLVATLTRQEGC